MRRNIRDRLSEPRQPVLRVKNKLEKRYTAHGSDLFQRILRAVQEEIADTEKRVYEQPQSKN